MLDWISMGKMNLPNPDSRHLALCFSSFASDAHFKWSALIKTGHFNAWLFWFGFGWHPKISLSVSEKIKWYHWNMGCVLDRTRSLIISFVNCFSGCFSVYRETEEENKQTQQSLAHESPLRQTGPPHDTSLSSKLESLTAFSIRRAIK